jgi:ribonuclease R
VEPVEAYDLLEHIRRQPHGRVSFKHLVRELGARGDARRSELAADLQRLVEQGRLAEVRSGHYVVPGENSELISGRFSLHRRGFGFVISDRPIAGIDGDLYIPRNATADAMHGDRVLARLARMSSDGRAEGKVQRILSRAHAYIVGEFRYSGHGSHVIPHDERVQQQIIIPLGEELPRSTTAGERLGNARGIEVHSPAELDGLIVNVAVTQFPTRQQEARGRVVEILGRPGDFGVDVEVIIRKFHLPYRFPPEVQDEVMRVSETISETELQRRRDFRHLDIVTIDGETARDFDDAVWVERLDNGGFQLQVHIADVSHYVQPASAIDQEARLRGTSVYFPDRAVPMLPAELSTGICSLNPGVDRLVLSALLEIDPQGATRRAEFCRGVIRSVERMTYTNLNLVLEDDPEQGRRYEKLAERFRLMKELAMILNRKRDRRGSIDFDLPEPVIEFDELGMMSGVGRRERNIAHRIIEEFMLTANEAVARRLEKAEIPALYRIHEEPDPQKVLEFEDLASKFGYSLGVDVPRKKLSYTRRGRDGSKPRRSIVVASGEIEISPRHYQKLIARIAGKPEERILSYQMLRSLKQARYSEKNVGHFALAAAAYTHFTSPIRRYPDLIVHRLLTWLLDQGPLSPYHDPKEGLLREGELAVIASETSTTERRAADAERALLDWKKARFMQERLGEEFDAIIVAVTPFGLFVELLDLFIEGIVPLASLGSEHFEYRENLRAFVTPRGKKRLTIGDRGRVRADRVAYPETRTEFSWLGEAASGG